MRDVIDFLTTLPEAALDRLYGDAYASVAVLRALPPLAQQCVLRLLVPGALPRSALDDIVVASARDELASALDLLARLHIVAGAVSSAVSASASALAHEHAAAATSASSSPSLQLNHAFALRVRASLTDALHPHGVLEAQTYTADVLCEYGERQWNSVLHFMADIDDPHGDVPSPSVQELLVHAGLMTTAEGGNADDGLLLTQEGFRFLFYDTHSQVWSFAMQYVRSASERGQRAVDVLCFLLRVSLQEVGLGYPIEDAHRRLLTDLRDVGVVFVPHGSQLYYPTPLSSALAVGSTSRARSDQYLLLDTNFWFIAYTSSPLHLRLLNMFSVQRYALPNVMIGTITRRKVLEAYEAGITAELLLKFIEQHGHTDMVSRHGASGPPNVVEQLLMWERQKERLTSEPCVLYDQFYSNTAYEQVRDYARAAGALLWAGDKSRVVVVRSGAAQSVDEFIRSSRDVVM